MGSNDICHHGVFRTLCGTCDEIKNLVKRWDHKWLLAVLDSGLQSYENRAERNFILSECRRRLVNQWGCDDCGAVAGQECKPEYGCTDHSRKVRNVVFTV